jgi:hypothetical protein
MVWPREGKQPAVAFGALVLFVGAGETVGVFELVPEFLRDVRGLRQVADAAAYGPEGLSRRTMRRWELVSRCRANVRRVRSMLRSGKWGTAMNRFRPNSLGEGWT